MNKPLFILYCGLLVFSLSVSAGNAAAKKADWVSKRPVDSRYHIGIGSCEKKGHADDFREVAENRALLDLASGISVNIAGSFIENTIERTGLTEQNIRMEIQSGTRARLTGHEMVGEWQDRKSYWVYFRIPKETYRKMLRQERTRAVASSLDMLEKAIAANDDGQPVSALRFYFESLDRIQDYIGDNLQADLDGSDVFLYNEIYTGIQQIMSATLFSATRERVPALAGHPLDDPLEVSLQRDAGQSGRSAIVGAPVRYILPWRTGDSDFQATTDTEGVARCTVPEISPGDQGKTVTAMLDVNGLLPEEKPGAFFKAILGKIDIPQSSIVLNVYTDENTYQWHREFEGRHVMVLSAYSDGEKNAEWNKIHDELSGFIQSRGGILVPASGANPEKIIQLSANPQKQWDLRSSGPLDLVFVMIARGRLNKRENAKNPFGEDAQFAGEIRTLTQMRGQPYFSDRYKGAGGWNPMGEEMAMEVLALHVFKRWKMKYFSHLKKP